jgi:hypothetical protein
MGNSESAVAKPIERERDLAGEGVISSPAANGTRPGTIVQQASYERYRRTSQSQPVRPPLGEIQLSDSRTSPPPAPKPSTAPSPPPRPPARRPSSASWSRTPPPQPSRPAVAITQASRSASESSDLGDRKKQSKWHGHPAVDVVRLVASGISRVRSKDSARSTRSNEAKPLLSAQSPDTPIQPQPQSEISSPTTAVEQMVTLEVSEPSKEPQAVPDAAPGKVEEPARAEEPAKAEEPVKADEPVKETAESQVKTPAGIAPVVVAESAKVEETAKDDESPKIEETAKDDESPKIEEPMVQAPEVIAEPTQPPAISVSTEPAISEADIKPDIVSPTGKSTSMNTAVG